LKLPSPISLEVNLQDVLMNRRTHRRFRSESISVGQLSTLLKNTWGITGYKEDSVLGRLPVKTSPSGGARHPEEVYVVSLRVKGLERGTYHYAPDRHELERVCLETDPQRAVVYCGGQEWVQQAAVIFIMTAVFARTMWKYPNPRAYRIVLAETGHLCQTLSLIATSLGLGSFSTMALNDSAIEKDLGLGRFEEAVLYVAGVGMPAG
jgi:SagB-type dehydrogenase family enzyme